MKIKSFFLLSGAIAFMVGAAPMIPALTSVANAAPVQIAKGMKFTQLNLTDDQKAQIKKIRESTRQQMGTILTPEQKEQLRSAKEKKQKPNLNLSADQKTKMRQIRESAKSQMEAILTPEQKQKLEQSRQQWRERRQQQQS